jgi:CheY-like chemotaxis protein
VDDDDDSRELVAEVLRDAGHDVVECATGEEALAHFETKCPDLLLTDIRLAGLTGVDLVRRTKADPRWARVPVWAITGYRASDMGEARSHFDDIWVKPIDTEKLVRALATREAPRVLEGPARGVPR